MYIHASETIIKMENFLLAIFDEIWPKTLVQVFDQILEQIKKFKNL